jgi:EPS-associated MarR family transcriptional regulator
MQPEDDMGYELLRQIDQAPAASQRKLAARLGVSVGKVNYCMRALVDKGWVKANNFRSSQNKLAYAYFLTPRGATAKAKLARAFLARKEAEYEALHSEIETLRSELTATTKL